MTMVNGKLKIVPGIYLVNKPLGRSSFSMVAQVRRLSGIKKVGHAGTLDPLAEGLLIVLVGKEYTKQAENYSKQDKTYEFSIKLGETSDTGDEQGEKRKYKVAHSTSSGSSKRIKDKVPTESGILEALEAYRGEISQTPPIYSAIKVNGVRAYKRARRGEKVEIKPRIVTVNRLEMLEYKYPTLKLVADVSSGTYIRSLGEDIGEKLGVGAYCTEIRRTRIGKFKIEDSIDLEYKSQRVIPN